MLLGLVGDVHGAFDALERVMAGEPAITTWLCVGDVASDAGEYPTPSRPLSFIKGNNENFERLARAEQGQIAPNLHLLPNGRLVDLAGVRVAGLGGTFAPTWYETSPEALPYPGSPAASPRPRVRDDKRRHFVRAEVEACAALRDIDLFLTHEAPRPCWVGTGRGRNDAGKTVINEILAAMRPRLHFFGHHHRFSEATVQGVPSIGLPLAGDSYVVVDATGWTWTRRNPPG